jgi:hypothetical protein
MPLSLGSDPAEPATAGNAGAPVDEIEVTPEMIEAGLPLLYGFTHESSLGEETIKEIFEAMMRVRRGQSRRS